MCVWCTLCVQFETGQQDGIEHAVSLTALWARRDASIASTGAKPLRLGRVVVSHTFITSVHTHSHLVLGFRSSSISLNRRSVRLCLCEWS